MYLACLNPGWNGSFVDDYCVVLRFGGESVAIDGMATAKGGKGICYQR